MKIYKIIKNNKKYLILGLIIIVLVSYFVFGKVKNSVQTFEVKRVNILQSLIFSGKVETRDKADLGFASTGRISKIFVKNNQIVNQGAILAQLELEDLIADLKIKKLNLKTSNVILNTAKENLQKVTIQENTKVENAYRKLLSDDLVLVPHSNDYGVDIPVITGSYEGNEGQYKLIIGKENVTSFDTLLRTFNLENTTQIINEERPTKLGTKGLYISFPNSDFSYYQDTIWFLDIPNKASVSYILNYNQYNEAKSERDLTIKNAQSKYDELLSEYSDGDSVAQAEIDKINAEIKKNTIYAPFDGKVTNIEKEIGENTSIGENIISILGEEKLQIVLQVSELDVSKLITGSAVKIFIDAFPGEEFDGILETVNSKDTKLDGVPIYEAFVELNTDNKIKTGMSAKGIIVLAKKDNVLAIPSYLIKKYENKNTIEVLEENGKIIEKEITLGLLGTDSMVEITSGLNEGEKIVSNFIKK